MPFIVHPTPPPAPSALVAPLVSGVATFPRPMPGPPVAGFVVPPPPTVTTAGGCRFVLTVNGWVKVCPRAK